MKRLMTWVVVVLAACGDGGVVPSTSSSPGTTATTEPVAIEIVEFAFGPDAVTIPAGTSVTWTNEEIGVPHTSTADDGAWDSGTLAEGEAFSHTFTDAGTFAYHCSIHPSMTGSVTVTD